MNATLRLVRDSRTYTRIGYLFLAFPLGMLYFIVIVTGLSTGLGMAIILVGFPVLIVTLLAWLLFARMERELAIHLLGAKVRPMSLPDPVQRTLWQRLVRTLADPVTWKSLVYVLLEFPFGVFAFTLAVVLLTVSLSFVLYPAGYALATYLYQQYPGQVHGIMWPGVTIDGHFDTTVALWFLVVSAFGVLFSLASLAILNGIGWLWGKFAELMLGVDESRLQLDVAKAEVATQQARADQAEQSRRELIVNASHELKTPVASISAHVESLLAPGREMDDETRKYLTVVAAETERLGSLVDDVLALATAEAGELHLDIGAVDVPAVIDQVCETLAPLARRQRNLSLVHSSAPELPRAMADHQRLAQVLTNLVRNAVNNTLDGGIISVEAAPAVIDQVCETLAPLARRQRNLSLVHSSTPELPRAMADHQRLAQVLTNLVRNAVNNTLDGGIISVEAAPAGDRVAITVSDTGIGMSPTDLAHVFDRFYRVDRSRSRDTGGSGLGLAIVRDLLSAMGGSIDAQSVPGQGSAFRVSLPMATA